MSTTANSFSTTRRLLNVQVTQTQSQIIVFAAVLTGADATTKPQGH